MLAVEIIVIGNIDEKWGEWLGGLKVAPCEADRTALNGVLPDQAALYGILARIRDLGLSLASLSAEPIDQDAMGVIEEGV